MLFYYPNICIFCICTTLICIKIQKINRKFRKCFLISYLNIKSESNVNPVSERLTINNQLAVEYTSYFLLLLVAPCLLCLVLFYFISKQLLVLIALWRNQNWRLFLKRKLSLLCQSKQKRKHPLSILNNYISWPTKLVFSLVLLGQQTDTSQFIMPKIIRGRLKQVFVLISCFSNTIEHTPRLWSE